MSETTIAPTTDNHQPKPADQLPDLQVGETVDVQLRGVKVDWHNAERNSIAFRFDVDGKPEHVWVPAGYAGLTITRTTPADGEPKPGELWADATGTVLLAFQAVGATGKVSPVWLLDPQTGQSDPWKLRHASGTGPIRRVATVDEIGRWT